MRLKIAGGALLLIILTCRFSATGQDVEGNMVYMSRIIANPAFTGSSPAGAIRLIYKDYYPGNGYNIGSLYFSFDSFFNRVHGGVGLYVQENSMGNILNDLRGGVTYSYHLRAGRDLYINAGFMASVIHRNIDISQFIFSDQIDPFLGAVLPTNEVIDFESGTIFDAGVGFLVIYRNYHAGISVNHLAKPDLTGTGMTGSRLQRRFTFHASGIFEIDGFDLTITPLADINLQYQYLWGSAGVVTGYKFFNISTIMHYSTAAGINSLQAGLFFELGKVGVGYNYYFRPFVSSKLIPLQQSNTITLVFGLNNVNKRRDLKAINYPKL